MNKDDIQRTLAKHADWLRGKDAGMRADLRGADLQGADLRGADLREAHLREADLQGADLQGSCLRGAHLQGTYLQGTTHGDGVPMTCTPIQVIGLPFPVLVLDRHIKIGCEIHTTTEWLTRDVPEDWKPWRDALVMLVETHQKEVDDATAIHGG